jgi:signal transduction histidine kinase
MTIRWKLNLSVTALILVFLVAMMFATRAVTSNAERTRSYLRMRSGSQFTSDLRTDMYQHLAAAAEVIHLPDEPERTPWPKYVLDDIDVQIAHAADEREAALWRDVAGAVSAAADRRGSSAASAAAVQAAERSLLTLRRYYDLAEIDATVQIARTSLMAQVMIWTSCALTVLLFLIYLIMVRHWLVTPIAVLKSSADAIGAGRLDHRVPLAGADELAQLARRIDAMAESLAKHQAELLRTRELSAIGELSTNVAHGLRNPLAALRAAAQLVQRRAAGSQPLESLVRDLVRQVDRMDARITRLFAFSRPCALRRDAVSFGELASSAQTEAAPLLQTHGIRLTIDDQTGSATWQLDRDQLADALGEVLTNATHHSPPGSEIILRGQGLPSVDGTVPRLQLEVIDYGAGMPSATLEKAFDPFFSGRPNGTGMGLAMVRRIVERHGGQIALTSQPGAGTTVTITL